MYSNKSNKCIQYIHVIKLFKNSWLHFYSGKYIPPKNHIPYIRLFTPHVLSANSSLKSCIKSTQMNFSRNPSESFKIYFSCKIVSNLRDWIFHDFDTLGNIAESRCTRKKPDIRYMYLITRSLFSTWNTQLKQIISEF